MKFTRFFLLRKLTADDDDRLLPANREQREFFLLMKDIIINQPNIDVTIALILSLITILNKPSETGIETFFALNFYIYIRLNIPVLVYFLFFDFMERVLSREDFKYWHTCKLILRVSKISFFFISFFLGLIFVLSFNGQQIFMDSSVSSFHFILLQFVAFYYMFRVGYFFLKITCNLFLCHILLSSVILSFIEDDFNKKLNNFVETQHYQPRSILSSQEGEYCSICLGLFQRKELISILPCSKRHSFHTKCLEKWFSNTLTCPLCRSDFNNSRINNINMFQELNELRENLV